MPGCLTPIFFYEKMRKDSDIFSIKNMRVLQILKFEILMKCKLMTSLVSNNRNQAAIKEQFDQDLQFAILSECLVIKPHLSIF